MTSPLESDSEARLPSEKDLDLVVHEREIAELIEESQTKAETTTNFVSSNLVEQQTTPQDEIHVAKCFKCSEAPLTFCRHCGQEFCSNHRSKYSDQYCYLCIAPDNLDLEFLPLEDEEVDPETGNTVIHRGRRIKLIGEGWPNTMQMVNSLSDEGLEIFIAERQKLLKEAVALGEYHRITLSHAEFTKEYKRHSKAVKLQRRREELEQGSLRLRGKVHRIGQSQVTKKQESIDEKIMKQLGLTPEQYKALMKVVNKI